MIVISSDRFELVVVAQPDGTRLLCAPTPGRVRWLRRAGEVLVAGSTAGVLVRDQHVFDLVVPSNGAGALARVDLHNAWTICARGTPLGAVTDATANVASSSKAAAGAEVSAGALWDVRSPTHGTFYRRPSPNAPAYVEAGQRIVRGQTLGLVEVMKCFSPITFDPPAGRESGTVVAAPVGDATEVQSDEILLRIELT